MWRAITVALAIPPIMTIGQLREIPIPTPGHLGVELWTTHPEPIIMALTTPSRPALAEDNTTSTAMGTRHTFQSADNKTFNILCLNKIITLAWLMRKC